MDPTLVGVIGIVCLLFLLAIGVHIPLALAAVGLVGSAILKGFEGAAVLATLGAYLRVAASTWLVIPLFVFMGMLAGAGGISRDIYKCVKLWVGNFRGALGVITVWSITLFGVCTGSSVATATVFSKISAPEMRRQGWDKRLAYGICCSAAPIGVFIPPSVIIVFYSVLAQASTGQLLIAGIVPGLLLTIFLTISILVIGYFRPNLVGSGEGSKEKVTWHERLVSLKLLLPIFIVAVVIIGGMFFGFFSPDEAAAWGALTLLVLIIITAGPNRWKIIWKGSMESISVSGMIFFIFVGATIFSSFLMLSGMTSRLLSFIIGLGLSKLGFVIMTAFMYLVMGCFLDATSMISITLPITIPIAHAMGINPIWFAMTNLLTVEIGLITPPVGLNVFAAKAVAESDVRLEDIFSGCFPMLAFMMAVVVLLIAFPQLTTFLPELMWNR